MVYMKTGRRLLKISLLMTMISIIIIVRLINPGGPFVGSSADLSKLPTFSFFEIFFSYFMSNSNGSGTNKVN